MTADETPFAAAEGARAFAVRDCALISIATGRKCHALGSFREHLRAVEVESVYHHFWGGLLLPRFEAREYYNDFADWARHGLHDTVLAERLAVIDPSEYADLEELRRELVDVVEERIDESERLSYVRSTHPFEFLRSQIVVFDTPRRLRTPEELLDVLAQLSPSSVFYHFIDARRRSPERCDDFSLWLEPFGPRVERLRRALGRIDPYFGTLPELRDRLARVVRDELEAPR